MTRFIVTAFGMLMYMATMAQNNDIHAVDVHSHLMTKSYLECLERNGALMEDGFPLPAWSEEGATIPDKKLILSDNALALFDAGDNHSQPSVTEPQCPKLPMAEDGIVRLSRIEVYPQYLDEYMKMATEVGAASLRTEPGVLTMYAVAEKNNPCIITILETYASQEAYKSHIASPHFQKYKQGTLHMVKSLELLDQTPLNPHSKIINKIE